MALSITTLRSTKPRAKLYKLADEKGLFLLVPPSGDMLWRWKCRIDGQDRAGNPKRVEKKRTLKANASGTAKRLRFQQSSLLAGMIDDGEGRAMTPSHATKPGKRYRYYVTRQA